MNDDQLPPRQRLPRRRTRRRRAGARRGRSRGDGRGRPAAGAARRPARGRAAGRRPAGGRDRRRARRRSTRPDAARCPRPRLRPSPGVAAGRVARGCRRPPPWPSSSVAACRASPQSTAGDDDDSAGSRLRPTSREPAADADGHRPRRPRRWPAARATQSDRPTQPTAAPTTAAAGAAGTPTTTMPARPAAAEPDRGRGADRARRPPTTSPTFAALGHAGSDPPPRDAALVRRSRRRPARRRVDADGRSCRGVRRRQPRPVGAPRCDRRARRSPRRGRSRAASLDRSKPSHPEAALAGALPLVFGAMPGTR